MASSPITYPIIDSHIHLFPRSELSQLAWMSASHPLNAQHSIAEYHIATSRNPSLQGFIFIEADRISTLNGGDNDQGWENPLREIDWLRRIVTGTPRDGEGHVTDDMNLCKGIVPWAPVPLGRQGLQEYLALAKERAGEAWGRVKGFRYLVQDKPRGVMLGEGFVDGLKWLGEQGFAFDLGVDMRQGGQWQLEEAVELMKRAVDGVDAEHRVRFIINHQCKPNMRLQTDDPTNDADFLAWKTLIGKMAMFDNACMKLSGGFAELPPQEKQNPWTPKEIASRIRPWVDVTLDSFGPDRILWGSDWPICNPGGAGNKFAWNSWRAAIQTILDERGLTEYEKTKIWAGSAKYWYRL